MRNVPYVNSVANAASRPTMCRSRSSPGSTRFAYASVSSTRRNVSNAARRAGSLTGRRDCGPPRGLLEELTGLDTRAVQPVARGHHALAWWLHLLKREQRSRPGPDKRHARADMYLTRRERREHPRVIRRPKRANFDPLATQSRPGTRCGIAAAHESVDREGRRLPVDASIIDVDLRRKADPVVGWGCAISEPSSMPSIVRTSSSAPELRSRLEQVARRVARTDGLGNDAVTGPVSRPSSSKNVQAPVTSSPAMTAC